MKPDRSKVNLERLKKVIERGKFVVLDTETSDIGPGCEIVQIAVCDMEGNELIKTLIKPTKPISQGAMKIHGITTELAMEEGQPWPGIYRALSEGIMCGFDVIIYNAAFDLDAIYKTCKAHAVDSAPLMSYVMEHPVTCAMLAYAEHAGIWDDYHNNYKWHKLTKACEQEGIMVKDAHDAMGDVLMTLDLCKVMAGVKQPV